MLPGLLELVDRDKLHTYVDETGKSGVKGWARVKGALQHLENEYPASTQRSTLSYLPPSPFLRSL